MNDWSKTASSSQWERINRTHFTDEALADLAHFKSSQVNHKLALWNPQTNGIRYLKEMVHNLCRQLAPGEWALLDAVENREVGDPYAITFDGRSVCMDYLQAVYEVAAIQETVPLQHARVLEIGAGYGRTCHTLLSNHSIAAYTIVDLEKALDLARAYLETVLPAERFQAIRFVRAEDLGRLDKDRFTLAVNIDSFAEMPEETVRTYLGFIDAHCDWFYVKNPVGKYLDPSLDVHSEGNEAVRLALASGILRDVIDIHDNAAVQEQSAKFLAAYAPGPGWETASETWARPWSFYWQAIYRNKEASHVS